MEIIQPPFLNKGDIIGIAATARKVTSEELQFAINHIQKRGYQVVLASNIYSESYQFAGDDESRRKGFQDLLDNPNIKAIFVVRGGYGTVRIIDRIKFDKFKQNPKWICGFSDITVLHSHLFRLGFQSIHSTMPLLFSQSEEATNSLFDILEGKKVNYELPVHLLNKYAEAEGIIIGGNLSVLYSLMGSVSQMDYKDKILFLEDTDEYLYHIDRMMMQMKRAGLLKHLKGLIIGGMSDMKDNTIPFGKDAFEIIHDSVKDYDYPICFNFPAGHIKENKAFIHGANVRMIVKDSGVIIKF